jgi:type II secretory pathway pseudopilin PulG
MDVGAVLIAVAGVAGTLGGALLTQQGAERAKRRELEMTQAIQEARESRELRRRCYSELHRDARQFCTALSRHLYVLRDRTPSDEDIQALEAAKDAHRDRWSEALMIAPDAVIAPAGEVNGSLTRVYGQVKRLEQGNPRPGETLRSAAEAQHGVWTLIAAMREAMRHDLGVTGNPGVRRSSQDADALLRDFAEPGEDPGT